jgi:hypothetical protein
VFKNYNRELKLRAIIQPKPDSRCGFPLYPGHLKTDIEQIPRIEAVLINLNNGKIQNNRFKQSITPLPRISKYFLKLKECFLQVTV